MHSGVYTLIWIFLLGASHANANPDNKNDTLAVTPHFSFHNNELMNLHHFLYEEASQQQAKHLLKDGQNLSMTEDSMSLTRLTKKERGIYEEAIRFYQENIIDQELLHSGRILKWLQLQDSKTLISDTTYLLAFSDILNRIKPVYSKHFWPRHQESNHKLLLQYINLIEETESFVIEKMESLSGSEWNQIVRVDLTTYGNWAGAYSPADDNIIVSSIDPEFHSSLYIEFVFHESSHLLFLRSSPFRKAMSEAYKTLKIKPSRSLWHAAMFYMCGLATQEALLKHDINHVQIMEAKDVFGTYYSNTFFRSILDQYYKRETGLEQTVTALVKLRIE